MFIKILKWGGLAILVGYVALVIYRGFVLNGQDKTNAQVAKIHNTKLTLNDVFGKNLPPPPANPDATIAGVDANRNGVRDDVELAIFKEYPNSARTRAVLLQYALALQMEMIQTVVNTGTVNAVIGEDSRAGTCIADTLVPRKSPESSRAYSDIEKIDAYTRFVDGKQFNTVERKAAKDEFYNHLGSYSNSSNLLCDIDASLLLN